MCWNRPELSLCHIPSGQRLLAHLISCRDGQRQPGTREEVGAGIFFSKSSNRCPREPLHLLLSANSP